MSANACIALEKDGRINYIFCHYDGMPKYLGVILKSLFSKVCETEKLISYGDIFSILPYDKNVFTEESYKKFGAFMIKVSNKKNFFMENEQIFLNPDTWIENINIEFLYLQKSAGDWHFYKHDYSGEIYEINYSDEALRKMTSDFFSRLNCLISKSESEYNKMSKSEIYYKLNIYVHKMLSSMDIKTITDIHNRAVFEKSASTGNYSGYVSNLIVFKDVSVHDILDMVDFDMISKFIINNVFVKGNTWLYDIKDANNFMKDHSNIFQHAVSKLTDESKPGYKLQ